MVITSAELCEGLPIEFEEFIEYIKNLEYTQKPDYDFLRNLLMSVMKNNKLIYNYIFDWTTKKEIKKRADVEDRRRENSLRKPNSSKNVIYDINDSNYIYNSNNKKNRIKEYNKHRRNVNILHSNDFLPIVKYNNNNKEDEVNIICSSVCDIF